MGKLPPPFKTSGEYEAGIDGRLQTEEVREERIYNCMLRLRGMGPEALGLPATVADIRPTAGGLALQLCLKDLDMKEWMQGYGRMRDGIWMPAESSFVMQVENNVVVVAQGYLRPYSDEIDRAGLE